MRRSPARTAPVRPGRPAGDHQQLPAGAVHDLPDRADRRPVGELHGQALQLVDVELVGVARRRQRRGVDQQPVPRRSSAASRSGPRRTATSSRPECGRAASTVSEPAAAPSRQPPDQHGTRGEPLLRGVGAHVDDQLAAQAVRPHDHPHEEQRRLGRTRMRCGGSLSGRCRRHPPAHPDHRCRSPRCAGRWRSAHPGR